MILATAEWLYAIGVLVGAFIAIHVGLWASVAWHEFGHIVGSWLTGSRIFEVSIGSDKRWQLWLFGTCWNFSLYPNGGYVITLPKTPHHYRLRQFIVLALGPLFSLSYLGFLVWRLNQTGPTYGRLDLAYNVVLILFMLELRSLTNLWPAPAKVAGINTGNDTLQIGWLFTKPMPTPNALACQNAYTEASYLIAQGKLELARVWERKLAEIPADDLPIKEQHTLSAYFVGLEEWEPACRIAERVLAAPEIANDDPMRWEAADTFASAVLYGEDREAMPRAIELLEKIIAEFPSIITLKGTLGGLLFELGRIDEAEKTLREVIAESTAAIDQGISSAYLARIAEQRGSTEEARKFAEAATKHAGEMAVVKRILAGLRGSQP